MSKKIYWSWDEVSQIMSDAFNLGKQVVRNADYYSLSSPLEELKEKTLQLKQDKPIIKKEKINNPKKLKNSFVDASGMIWQIKKESLPKESGGVMTYYVAETIIGNGTFREKLKRDLINKIKEKYGEFKK